jgi:hypothetical protein
MLDYPTRELVYSIRKDSKNYDLLNLDHVDDEYLNGHFREVREELSVIFDKANINMFASLNTSSVLVLLKSSLMSSTIRAKFSVDGLGGTGRRICTRHSLLRLIPQDKYLLQQWHLV